MNKHLSSRRSARAVAFLLFSVVCLLPISIAWAGTIGGGGGGGDSYYDLSLPSSDAITVSSILVDVYNSNTGTFDLETNSTIGVSVPSQSYNNGYFTPSYISYSNLITPTGNGYITLGNGGMLSLSDGIGETLTYNNTGGQLQLGYTWQDSVVGDPTQESTIPATVNSDGSITLGTLTLNSSYVPPSGGPVGQGPEFYADGQLVPEPATITLLGTALLGLGVVYLRRRRAKA